MRVAADVATGTRIGRRSGPLGDVMPAVNAPLKPQPYANNGAG